VRHAVNIEVGVASVGKRNIAGAGAIGPASSDLSLSGALHDNLSPCIKGFLPNPTSSLEPSLPDRKNARNPSNR